MPGQHEPLFAQLAKRFSRDEEKKLTKGKEITYVTARSVMNRLDAVLGAENWWDAYSPLSNDSILCHLSIRLPGGEVVTKTDAGGAANMKDAGDDDKSMVSDAFKRAAARFGVGRYLYGDGVAAYVVDELTRAAEERRAARVQPEPPTTLPDSREAINEAFSPAEAPEGKAPARPANDREKIKLPGDRIGAKGLDVRLWTRLVSEEVAAWNALVNGDRARLGLGPLEDRDAMSGYQFERHMLKEAIKVEADGADGLEPMGEDGKRKRVGPGKIGSYLANLYLVPDWREWMRGEARVYLKAKAREAKQVAENEAGVDGTTLEGGAEAEAGTEADGQLVPAGGVDDGWQPGRE